MNETLRGHITDIKSEPETPSSSLESLSSENFKSHYFSFENPLFLTPLSNHSTEEKLLVVEPDYLPDLEVFYFQPCLYPMKYLHPRSMYTLPRGGVQRGGTPSAGSGGAIPPAGGSGGKRAPRGFGGEAPEAKIAL
jgi:hypothetical protein